MRLLIFFCLLTAFAASLSAQEETLSDLNGESGGFGGPVVKYTAVNGQGAIMLGGRGGWIFDNSFVIGGGGYAVVSEVDAANTILPIAGPLDIEFTCLGLEVERIFHPNSLIYYSLYTLVGMGTNRFVKDVGPVSKSNEQYEETDFMFVIEPAANVEVNVTEWFRIASGVTYRIASGVDQVGLENSDFTGPSASLTFKFGTF